MQPLVSIIVPAYNRAHLIVETLDSIYKQNYRNIELIVVDDGSSDNTKSVVNKWLEKKSSRFEQTLFHSFEQNKGKSEAVNYGFSVFRGEFVMVFDSDDILLPDAIENEVSHLLKNPKIDCMSAGALLMNGSKKTTIQFHPFRDGGNFDNITEHYGDLLLKGNSIISSTVLMKRSVVKSIGGLHPDLRITHDWDYWIRVTREFRFGFMNIPVMYYRANADGSVSQNKLKLFLEVIKVLSIHCKEYTRPTMLKAFLYQIRYHLWLAKKDHNPIQFCQIGLFGSFLIVRFIISGK